MRFYHIGFWFSVSVLAGTVPSNAGINHGSALAVPVVICNLVTGIATGVGAGTCASPTATCNGVADDTAAFNAFATWATGTWQAGNTGLIGLLLPAGANCQLTTSAVTFAGIKQLVVLGTGATLGGGYFHLAGLGQYQDNTHQARTQTVVAGASSLTLVTAGQTSLFTVGQWALMTGLSLQDNGLPTNQFYFEFAKVTAKDGACTGTGTVCFSAPLKLSYKSTWPVYNTGGAFDPDHGGPATLYVLHPEWDTEVEWRGMTFTQAAETDAAGRQIVFRNVTFTGSGSPSCVFPSSNLSFSIIGGNLANCQMEVDKLIENATLSNVTITTIEFQSTGVNNFTLSNSTVSTLLGTGKKNTITDTTISTFSPGESQGFGRTDEIICTRCAITTLQPGGYQEAIGGTMSGGVITLPNSGGPYRWAVPGSNIAWTDDQAQHPWSLFFQVTDVTQSGSNTLVTTSLSGGFPSIPTGGPPGTVLRVFEHPAPKFTCVSCTGSDLMKSLSLAPAAAPLWANQQFTYTGAVGSTAQANVFGVWGGTATIDINVTAAYTGVGTLSYDIGQNYSGVKSTNAWANYDANVNAKSAGHRQIMESGVTCLSGTCTGDSGLTLPDATQFIFTGVPGTGGPKYSADVSGSCPGAGCPSVTVTIQTNQGVVNP